MPYQRVLLLSPSPYSIAPKHTNLFLTQLLEPGLRRYQCWAEETPCDRWLYSSSPGPTGAQETHVHSNRQTASWSNSLPPFADLPAPKTLPPFADLPALKTHQKSSHLYGESNSESEAQGCAPGPRNYRTTTESRSAPPAQERGAQPKALV